MTCSDNSKSIDHYKKKYTPMESLCLFQNCRVYFYEMSIMNKDLKTVSELALRRMKLEITMRGGEICDSLSHATHIVAYSLIGSHNFEQLYQSFLPAQRRNLYGKKKHVVRHQWLDDSLSKGKRLAEIAYNLKPDTLEDLIFEESEEEVDIPPTKAEEKISSKSADTGGKRKRERPALAKAKRGKPAPKLYKRTRARTGTRTAKIKSDETEDKEVNDDEYDDDSKEADETFEDDKKMEAEIVQDSGDANVTEENIEEIFDRGSEIVNVDESRKEGAGEQIEQMVDPLQALLLDMIPSLSQKKSVATATGSGSGSCTALNVEEAKIEGESDANPAKKKKKKKKVSYKDVANQLLKDW